MGVTCVCIGFTGTEEPAVGFGEAEGMGERDACLPSGTAVDSETRFYSHHENYHVPHDIDFLHGAGTMPKTFHKRQP